MHKPWFILPLIAVIFLSACGLSNAPVPTESGGAAVTAQPAGQQPTATATAPAAVATRDPNADVMACQVVSIEPTQSPEDASKFPPPGKDDQTLGSAKKPIMTVIEYSDFQ